MDQRADDIERIMHAINAGDPGGALKLIERVIGESGGDLAVHFLKSEALRQMGDLSAAEDLLVLIHRDAPSNAEVLFRLGLTRFERNNLAGAVEALDAAVQRANDHQGSWFHLGRTLFLLGRYEDAEKALRRAAELNPSSVSALINLSICLARQKNNGGVAVELEEKLLMESAEEGTAGELLNIYISQSLYGAAAYISMAMIIVFSESTYWVGTLGAIMNTLGRYKEAIACCRQAIELEPNSTKFTSHLGMALRQTGLVQDAEEILKRAISLDPSSADANMGLASLYLDTGRFEIASQLVDTYDQRVGLPCSIKRSVVIAVLDYSPGSPFNILTLLDDLKTFDGEVVCVFNDELVFNDLRTHPRIDKYSFNKFNVGVSRGWNIGINQAEGDTIHILNADLHISVEMLSRMEHWLHTLPDALCVGITAHWMDFDTMKETRVLNAGTYPEPMETDAVSGQLLSLHSHRLHDAGITFDPRLAPYFGEETDLALKIRKSGFKVYAVPENDFEHPWGISLHDRPVFFFGRQVNRMRCMVHNRVLLKRKIDTYFRDLAGRRTED